MRISDRIRDGIIGSFDLPDENDNGWRVIDFCVKKNLYCKHFLLSQENPQVYMG